MTYKTLLQEIDGQGSNSTGQMGYGINKTNNNDPKIAL